LTFSTNIDIYLLDCTCKKNFFFDESKGVNVAKKTSSEPQPQQPAESKTRQAEKKQETHAKVVRKKNTLAPNVSLSEMVVKEIDKRVKRKQSIAQAADAVSAQFNKTPAAIRKIYRVEKEKSAYRSTASQPMHFADIAILQLGRISKKDKGWNEALQSVETWIENFRRKNE
jgi:vancomycin resistance protein YoaR